MIARRFAAIAVIVTALIVGGTIGFHVVEGWSWLDAFYATVITLTTVGYGDFHPVSAPGKFFAITLILSGVGTMALALSTLYEILLSDETRRRWQLRRRHRMIEKLHDHIIVCGFGRMGRHVADSFTSESIPVVLLDKSEDVVAHALDEGRVAIVGTGSEEEDLRKAGIEKARCLIITVDSDAEAVFVCLTARALNDAIQIVSRANNDDSLAKLERAGADRVVLPYAIGGQRMVSLVRRPAVTEFVDVVMSSAEFAFCLDEITVPEDSELAGKSLAEIRPRQEFSVTVLAIHQPGGPMLTNPQASDVLLPGTRVIALGTADHLEAFAKKVRGE